MKSLSQFPGASETACRFECPLIQRQCHLRIAVSSKLSGDRIQQLDMLETSPTGAPSGNIRSIQIQLRRLLPLSRLRIRYREFTCAIPDRPTVAAIHGSAEIAKLFQTPDAR